jgi:hypothetical protein
MFYPEVGMDIVVRASIRPRACHLNVEQCCAQAFLPIGAAVIAFLVDVHVPNGMLDGLLYVLAVLACHRVPNANAALYTAWGVMPPMILGLLLSPMGAPIWMAFTNRLMAIVIIWIAAFVVSRSVRATSTNESALVEIQRRLRGAEHFANDERTGLSDWLREEISLELSVIDWRLNRLSRAAGSQFDLKTEALLLRRAIQRTRHSVYGKELRLRDVTTDAGPTSLAFQ